MGSREHLIIPLGEIKEKKLFTPLWFLACRLVRRSSSAFGQCMGVAMSNLLCALNLIICLKQ